MITLAAVSGGSVLTLAAFFWLIAFLADRPEGGHARPSRPAAAWWRCRDRAAYRWWWCYAWSVYLRARWGVLVLRVSFRLRGRWKNWSLPEVHHERKMPAPATEEVMPSGPAAAGQHDSDAGDPRLRVAGRPGQPGNNGSERAGLAGREQLIIAPVAAQEAGDVTRTSPALPPAVTQAFAAAWATLDGFSQVEFDTAWFTAIKAGA